MLSLNFIKMEDSVWASWSIRIWPLRHLLSKWGWRFSEEQSSLWCQVIRSNHGSSTLNWHSSGKETASLRSSCISISRQWRKIDSLALFKLGDGSRIVFWKHPWMDNITLECKFPRLVRIALNPNGSISYHCSWSIYFKWLLNDEEILDFQSLLNQISSSQRASFLDRRFWYLGTSGSFSVKSLVKHLSTSSPLDISLYKRLWQSNSPKKVNISIWIMLFGKLNCASVLQRKLPSHVL